MKGKVLCLVVAMAMLVPLLAGACAAPAEKEPIKIGFMTDLTSFLSVNGIPQREGAILAMEEAGYTVAGRPVELKIEDSASDPALAMDKARKLLETDKVCMIIGPFHGGAMEAVAGYCDKTRTPQLSHAFGISEKIQVKYNWSWAVWGLTPQLSYVTGAYAYDVLGYRTATTMGTDYVAGREFMAGFVAAFTERGGKVIQQQWIPLGTKDVAPYISALKEADVLVPWLAGITATVGLRQFREYKVPMPVVMPQSSFPAIPKQIAEIADDGVGIITTDAYVWTLDVPGNKEFVERYQKRWGEVPANCSYFGYGSVQIALEALRKTGGDTSPEALAKALDETTFDSLVGPISFEEQIWLGHYLVHKVIKVGDEYLTEVLARYIVRADKVGDKFKYSVVDYRIIK